MRGSAVLGYDMIRSALIVLLICIEAIYLSGCFHKESGKKDEIGYLPKRGLVNDLKYHIFTISDSLGKKRYFSSCLDTTVFNEKISDIAIKLSSQKSISDTIRINLLNDLLFLQERIEFNQDQNTLENLFPQCVLANRRGSCTGIALLYLLIAQEAKIPLSAILLPGHIYLSYRDGVITRNIEPNKNGIDHPENYYRMSYEIDNKSWYRFESLTNEQMIGVLYYTVGSSLLSKQDPVLALTYLQTSIRYYPELYIAWGNMGVSYSRLGDYKNAQQAFEKAVSLNRSDAAIWLNKGTCELQNKKSVRQAIKSYEEGLLLAPMDVNLLYGIAYAYFRIGQPDSTIFYLKAIRTLGMDTIPQVKALEKSLSNKHLNFKQD